MNKVFKLPIQFEQNEGQTDSAVRYLTRGPGYKFYFKPQEVAIVLTNPQGTKTVSSALLKMQLVDANSNPLIKGIDKLHCKSNYFIGNDKNSWFSNISNYRKVAYQDLYPGIDTIFYGNPDQLEYDICVAPGANPSLTRLPLEGAEELLVIRKAIGFICFPSSYDFLFRYPQFANRSLWAGLLASHHIYPSPFFLLTSIK
ncbi:hypothetical protein [Candidatus Protochlamydia naegleriophila]|nr:hypothetical protein [Candidatus Protochlamydia naegleriophila]